MFSPLVWYSLSVRCTPDLSERGEWWDGMDGRERTYLFLLQPLEHHFCVLPLEVAMDTPLLDDLRRLISVMISWWRGFKKRKGRMLCFWGVAGELPKRQSQAEPRWLWLCWLLWRLLKLWNGASLSLQRRLRAPRPQGPSARDLLVDHGEEAAGTLNSLLSRTPTSSGRVLVLEYRAALKCLLPSCKSAFLEDKWGVLCSFPCWRSGPFGSRSGGHWVFLEGNILGGSRPVFSLGVGYRNFWG